MRLELGEWLLRLHDETGLTTLLVTHDQPEAFALASHLVVLFDGRVAQAGTPAELRAQAGGRPPRGVPARRAPPARRGLIRPGLPFRREGTCCRPGPLDPESLRLAEDRDRKANWKRWGPYLAERQWGTVREDYSAGRRGLDVLARTMLPARERTGGERTGSPGFRTATACICLAPAFWNGHDPILKERLFGLSGPEGNHGEDAKEYWFYLDATPTHS